jgi:hypothetical protein
MCLPWTRSKALHRHDEIEARVNLFLNPRRFNRPKRQIQGEPEGARMREEKQRESNRGDHAAVFHELPGGVGWVRSQAIRIAMIGMLSPTIRLIAMAPR